MQILDGKSLSLKIQEELKEKVSSLKTKPCLAVILVGDDKASQVYVRNKEKAAQYIGINTTTYKLEESTSTEDLLALIDKLNNDFSINGILVQLPLPKHIEEEKVLFSIRPEKDVDGFHPTNVGHLHLGTPKMVPCTPAGIIRLLDTYKIPIDGKNAVVIGRSSIVGKPIAQLLLERNATVTLTHSHTHNLKEIVKKADIVVAAIGKPKFVTKDFIKEGAVVIDVGINRNENNKLVGDVDFENVKDLTSFITPVPGGVGPLTVTMLMEQTYKAYLNQQGE
jgi:methylenetetrahydrofolate dehydrogenase (NADP+)/methenyltetrahydrofolate cyclohydrolase